MSNKNKKVTAKQFADLIGLNTRAKFCVKKLYDKVEKATLTQWSEIFIENNLIDKTPSIVGKNKK